MAPRIDGETHTFVEHGLYDGLFLMRDEETGTYWDHMTGEAVYGPLVGTSLEVANLRQTTVAQVLGASPDAMVALSDRTMGEDEDLQTQGLLARVGSRLNAMFSATVKEEDTRRPTMDLGMGIWQGDVARYYPYDHVLQAGKAVIDTFEGRRVLVYLDPAAYALSALYVEGDTPQWDGDVLRLSDGTYVEGGVVYGASGSKTTVNRPLQVFTRWYGFSLTFPDTEIFEAGR